MQEDQSKIESKVLEFLKKEQGTLPAVKYVKETLHIGLNEAVEFVVDIAKRNPDIKPPKPKLNIKPDIEDDPREMKQAYAILGIFIAVVLILLWIVSLFQK